MTSLVSSPTEGRGLPAPSGPAKLRRILKPEENGYLLRRSLPRSLAVALSRVVELEPFELKLPVAAISDASRLCAPLGAAAQAALGVDVARWISAFSELIPDAPIVGSLCLTRSDDCRKYHVDWVGLRLIVTYVGPGTEWAPDHAVHRPALAAPWRSLSAINRAIVPGPTQVRRARAGDVLLLKGESYPGNAGRGAVHRSPPIAHRSDVRLVFKLTATR
ncbi:MAG TPA: DUF1826 domain-containing protein [Polyangiaceae bacterium]|nr:DUF1826 domain-containing protein [Polyangiaceae bacterium]